MHTAIYFTIDNGHRKILGTSRSSYIDVLAFISKAELAFYEKQLGHSVDRLFAKIDDEIFELIKPQ